ncbi:putative FCP1 domain, HAD superfamily protein [Helianthus annuus]|nr:putative FCP1 domain, HAD superfamily protein [Helianthus annuus]
MEYASAAKRRKKISHATKEAHFDNTKKLLVLDVDVLLTHVAAEGDNRIFKRLFCDEFLEFCFQRFNVGVWTSRTRSTMEHALDFLMRDNKHRLLFRWDLAHCTEMGFNDGNEDHIFFVKELRKLWEKKDPSLPWEVGEYDESNTLLVENYPHAALDDPVSPEGDLRIYLERLAASQNVQNFVSENRFDQHLVHVSENYPWISSEDFLKFLHKYSYKHKAGDSMDAQRKNSLEPKVNSSSPLAAQTSLEPETSTTTALVGQPLSEPDLSNTGLGAHTSTEPQTTTDYQQDWPFIKHSPIWATIDSLVSCLKPPQKPHFSPLKNTKELHREGLAIAHMMTCYNLNDPVDIINDNLEVLVDLEAHGFDVDLTRCRLNELLSLKSRAGQHEDTLKELEKRSYEKLVIEKEMDQLKVEMEKLQEKMMHAEIMRKAKEEELVRLQSNLHPGFTQFNDWEVAFGKLAATPL